MAVLHARVANEREFRRLLRDIPVDGLVVLGYDAEDQICGLAVNPRHRSLSWLKIWELADIAVELRACSLQVVVFPAGGSPTPTAHECAVFADLMVRARRAAVPLVDCYVDRGGRLWSLRAANEERIGA
jgi:hypothetical protein